MGASRSHGDLPADPHTLLSLFSTHVPSPAGERSRSPTLVFVLGMNERRVTVYSQQCRALNLIWLLHETEVLKSAGRVAVVGAGAGGLTAAAAAACKGHKVFLLNDSFEAMPQQRFAQHRWLHPHIFDWPTEGWWKEDANLPLLPWREQDAHRVRRQIIDEFNGSAWRAPVDYRDGVEHVGVVPAQGGQSLPTVSWSRGGERQEEQVNVVVLAVGFGLERSKEFTRPPVYHDSYWDDPGRRWTSPGTALISGGGDGGLTEVLHAVLGEDFEHSQILRLAGYRRFRGEKRWVKQVRNDILSFEERWRHRRRPPAIEAERTMEAFAKLDAKECDNLLDKMLRDRRQSAAREVILVVNDDDLAVTSCAINRFLVARLRDHVTITHASLEEDDVLKQERGPYTPTLKSLSDKRPLPPVKVDSVVIRHGPESSPLETFQEQVVPEVDRKLFGGPAAGLVDTTRQPHWPDAFYEQCRDTLERPPRPIQDPPVLVARDGAIRTSSHLDLSEIGDPARVVVGALEAAAVAGLALTQAAMERVARVSRTETTRIARQLFPEAPASPAASFTIDDEALSRRRKQLSSRASEAASRRRDSQDRAGEMLDLGNLRAGALAGAVADDPDAPVEVAPAMLERLKKNDLPWWTAYGYAAARYDDVETQLAFARQLIGFASDQKLPDSDREAAYTALRRSIRCLAAKQAPDPELWAEVLIEAAVFMASCARDEAMSSFAEELAGRWGMDRRDLSAVGALLTLRAVEPNWPGRTRRWILTTFRRRISLPGSLALDWLPEPEGLPHPAGEVLAQLTKPDDPPSWNSILRAEHAVREKSVAAAEHVAWVLDSD